MIRPDIFFTPYIPAVILATAIGGLRVGTATALAGGALGVLVNFGPEEPDPSRLALLVIYLIVCGLTIWGIEHYRAIASHQRDISNRLIQEEEYRRLVVDELQHRLKNKLSTVHAVLHQVLQDQPKVWASVDQRIRALSATDDLIARADGRGCDIKDLLLSELGPYGHVGLFCLRVEAIFFAMITLAVASAFLVLASQLSWLTGGEDGRSFQLPPLLRPGTVLIPKDMLGFEINGRVLT
ncbi:MAG: hypothetical protein NVSMB20_04710 [Bradyrhizobium sp.]